jgi:Uma2 family endonuclease
MATISEPSPFVWTREVYQRAGEFGLFGDLRVELVEGVVLQMSPMKARHATICGLFSDALAMAFGAAFHVRVQFPLTLSDLSEPEPDVAVVRGTRRDYLQSHPHFAELVVKISDTTLTFDRKNKAAIYTKAGIPDYWIANLEAGHIEVFRKPDISGQYLERFVVKVGEQISPLGAPNLDLSVSELLPVQAT